MRIAAAVFSFLLLPLTHAEAGQWAPVARTGQWAAPAKTEQWAAPTKTEQWSAPTKTEQRASEVRTEVRDPELTGQQTAQPVPDDSTTDGRKLVWVNWNGQPYQAWILKSEGKRHYVTYKGWPSNYNEWIPKGSVLTEAQAKRMLARQKRRVNAAGNSSTSKGYEQMDRSRELSNRLHQETQQQYRDTERYYEERRYR